MVTDFMILLHNTSVYLLWNQHPYTRILNKSRICFVVNIYVTPSELQGMLAGFLCGGLREMNAETYALLSDFIAMVMVLE